MKYFIVSREDLKSKSVENELKNRIKLEYNSYNPDYVIAVGGDGTLLKAVRSYPSSIIFGLHTGHLGFYANYTLEEIDILVNDINNNDFQIEETELLKCDVTKLDGSHVTDYALNEITVISPAKTIIEDVYVDDKYFEKFRGTGLCISTSTGSTAYNRSLGGAVIDPSIKAIQLTEIAGINSNAYRSLGSSFVLGHDRVIKICENIYTESHVVFDSISNPIIGFKELSIYYAGNNIKRAYHERSGLLKRLNRTFLYTND